MEIRVPDIGDFADVPVIEVHVSPGDVVAVEVRQQDVTDRPRVASDAAHPEDRGRPEVDRDGRAAGVDQIAGMETTLRVEGVAGAEESHARHAAP